MNRVPHRLIPRAHRRRLQRTACRPNRQYRRQHVEVLREDAKNWSTSALTFSMFADYMNNPTRE